MKIGIAVAVAMTLTGLAAFEHAHRAPAAIDRQPQPTPVVVELFTSEGCSSCPPADDLLARFVKTQPIPGAQIIALGQHVDYWNRLGWTDPYSSAGFSTRQSAYARAFQQEGVYTPQMVVDGQVGFVGSDVTQAESAISRAARTPKAVVQVSLAPGVQPANGVGLQVSVDHLPGAGDHRTADVILALTEDGLHSSVQRGENAGRTLAHVAVVRQMTLIGNTGTGQSEFAAHAALQVGWRRENLRAVVFVQERASHQIIGAASIRLN